MKKKFTELHSQELLLNTHGNKSTHECKQSQLQSKEGSGIHWQQAQTV